MLKDRIKFLDFHSHILPKIDDGSKSVEESLAMLEDSLENGVERIVATPHFYSYERKLDEFLAERENSLNALLEKRGDRKLPEICVGAEVGYFFGMSSSRELKKLCIKGTRLLLIEMPFRKWRKEEIEDVTSIVVSLGITPVLAHVNRYLNFVSTSQLIAMAKRGVLMQWNCEFFINDAKEKQIKKVFKDELITCLGSDCHNMEKRRQNMEKCVNILESVNAEVTEIIFAISFDVLRGAEIY